ncbi:TIM barrel protein [Shinella sp.]|uniref:sugar phosphate isomerase/epimerase family protein n=1 Tax=Shinella sp. TaxID=1870904 RepID=UPI0025907B0A|nr:TIM barrel protein [Shinella sp.]MCW5706871.1 TIM barrel protein [Shinella sp.]
MQSIRIFQSLWAMELRRPDGFERSVEENVQMIADAGYDGVSAHWYDRSYVQALAPLLRERGLEVEAQSFPKSVEDIIPTLELAVEFGVHHVAVQPDVRPRKLEDAIRIIEGWRELGTQAGVSVFFETHRDRMTNDLHFTLDLLDAIPDLTLLGDISHYVVGREYTFPIDQQKHDDFHQILDHVHAFHGRVASGEQVQLPLSFAHNEAWFGQFLEWWEYGFRSWRRRAPQDATLAFTCELGPQPYAIAGPDGYDLTDRWSEALLLRDRVLKAWHQSEVGEDAAVKMINER